MVYLITFGEFLSVNVATYVSPMDPMGWDHFCLEWKLFSMEFFTFVRHPTVVLGD